MAMLCRQFGIAETYWQIVLMALAWLEMVAGFYPLAPWGTCEKAQRATAFQKGIVAELLGFDQDASAVAFVNKHFDGLPVKAVQGTIRSLLAGQAAFQDIDFAYAAGLFDYLGERSAGYLCIMFDMLNPGGHLLIANFAPSLRDIGYMEAFMHWNLIYRTAAEIERLTCEISGGEISHKHIFWDDNKCMVFLNITQKRFNAICPSKSHSPARLSM